MSKTAVEQGRLIVRQRHRGTFTGVLKVLFWIHQFFLGIPSMFFGLDLLTHGKTDGIINVIGLLLVWIGGTLVWGLAAIMYERSDYELPALLNSALSWPEPGVTATTNEPPL